MTYPLSVSQQEVLKLENVAGAEINTLSASVLFPFRGGGTPGIGNPVSGGVYPGIPDKGEWFRCRS